MNNPFEDIGELIMVPVQSNIESEEIDHYEIIDQIEIIISQLMIKDINIVAHEESSIFMLSDFLRSCSDKFNICSINTMSNYKITNISGKFNNYVDTIILHNGTNLDKNQMSLRIFSTVPYLKTIPTFVTLFKNKDSDFYIVNKEAKKYIGYGKYDQQYQGHDQYIVKIIE